MSYYILYCTVNPNPIPLSISVAIFYTAPEQNVYKHLNLIAFRSHDKRLKQGTSKNQQTHRQIIQPRIFFTLLPSIVERLDYISSHPAQSSPPPSSDSTRPISKSKSYILVMNRLDRYIQYIQMQLVISGKPLNCDCEEVWFSVCIAFDPGDGWMASLVGWCPLCHYDSPP